MTDTHLLLLLLLLLPVRMKFIYFPPLVSCNFPQAPHFSLASHNTNASIAANDRSRSEVASLTIGGTDLRQDTGAAVVKALYTLAHKSRLARRLLTTDDESNCGHCVSIYPSALSQLPQQLRRRLRRRRRRRRLMTNMGTKLTLLLVEVVVPLTIDRSLSLSLYLAH